MKSLTLAVALLSTAICAQGDQKKPVGDYQITLSAKQEIAVVGGNVSLALSIEVRNDTSLPATVLAGYELETEIDGKKGPRLKNTFPGKVKLATGTTITRTISIPVDRILGGKGGSALRRVSFKWPGLIGVNASIGIAPDMSKIDVSSLDLAKTTVTMVTSMGQMKIKFRPDKAPKHVENFVRLSKEGFYNGTRFHRVIRGFMIQGGCPYSKKGSKGTPGTGDAGKTLKAEFNDLKHLRGVLSAARSADPDSASCQFFVVHQAAHHLDGQYTAFGELESGYETLDKIATLPVRGSEPKENVWVTAMIVHPVFKEKKK